MGPGGPLLRLTNGSLCFSATDLSNFSACAHRTLLDRLPAPGLAPPDKFDEPLLALLQERGHEHEEAYVEKARADGKRVVDFDRISPGNHTPEEYRRREAQTLSAMREGADVIHQGCLYDGTWLGLVNFLIRVEEPSDLGVWSYEVVDAKPTREAKATAFLQTCAYSELLKRFQGRAPRHVHLYLGGPRPRTESFQLAHLVAYYRSLQRRFLEHVEAAADEVYAATDRVELCGVRAWRPRCDAERREADHLSLVAGIARDHRCTLTVVNVTTLEALADLPLHPQPDGLRPTGFRRIREQARVQQEGRRRNAPYYELLEIEEEGARTAQAADADGTPDALDVPPTPFRPLGLAALPAPSPHDLFFDIEGAALAGEDGLEYLWGLSTLDDDYVGDCAPTPFAEELASEHWLRGGYTTGGPGRATRGAHPSRGGADLVERAWAVRPPGR